MHIIELAPLENGAHRNQHADGALPLPEGWAEIPAGVELPETFPFVCISAEGGLVTALTENREAYDAAMAAEPEPQEDDVWAALDSAYRQGYTEGVNNV